MAGENAAAAAQNDSSPAPTARVVAEPAPGGELFSHRRDVMASGHRRDCKDAAIRAIAATERSTSASLVDQFDTAIRM